MISKLEKDRVRGREKYRRMREKQGKEVHKAKKLMDRGLKECFKCDSIKSICEFGYDSRTATKLRSRCKECDAKSYKEYASKNKDKINANRRNLRKDPIKAILFSMRARQRTLFKSNGVKKPQPQTAILKKLLGCSVEECKIHIESQFEDKMNWNNRGRYMDNWQIDHIIPVSLSELDENGNLLDTEMNRKIWHYTNLQPLWTIDNLKKSNKYEFA